MTSTFATVVIPSESQAAAQADLPGHFTSAYAADAAGPSTHYVSSGFFFDTELDMIVNEAEWPKRVRFGDAAVALADLGLVPVVEPVNG